MAIKSGSIIAGRYHVEKPISENGGTASVYLCGLTDDIKRKVAIKFARSDAMGKMQEDTLLELEADFLSKREVRHPGIIRVHPIMLDGRSPVYSLRAIDVADSPRFMVMDYLPGGSLAETMKKISGFPIGWKMDMYYQLLTAISHLHILGFGHRDLKPENIVFRDPVTPHTMPVPILIDFALTSNGVTKYEVVEASHTLAYASPERLLKSLGYDDLPPYPLEADIWSLGVILYELITGSHLIHGSENKVRTTIIRGAFEVEIESHQIESHSQVAKMVTKLIRKMLDPDPTKRPSVSFVLGTLEQLFPPPLLASN